MTTRRVGVREFRDRATRLIASGDVLAVEKHGALVGYFVPVEDSPPEATIELAVRRLRTEAKTLDLATLRSMRVRILEICVAYGAHNVRVFGSVARAEATVASDVDLLVDFEDGRTLLDQAGVAQDLAELLERPVDVVTERGLKPAVRASVIVEAQPL